MIRSLCILLFLALLFVSAEIAASQAEAASETDTSGIVDMGKAREKKIHELEYRLKLDPDKSAKEQAILLQWLIELYAAADRHQDVARSYEKILSFYPYDVRIINLYAEFLIDRQGNSNKAIKLLQEAIAYSRIYSVSTKLLGNSYFLLGKVHSNEDEHSAAIDQLEHARFLLGEEGSEEVIRLLAQNYHLAGRYNEAVEMFLELIGRARGSNPYDIEFLRGILPQSKRLHNKKMSDIIDEAVQKEVQRQKILHEAFGAEMVSIPSGDSVSLEGTLYRAEGPGTVLFIPEIGSTRLAWDVFAQMLSVEGITALSFDLRGHGGSRTETIRSPEDLTLTYISQLANDIAFVLQYMKTSLHVEDHEIVVVAEGRICSAIEEAFYRCNITASAVYLSPFFDPASRDLYNAIAFRKDRPLFIMYSCEDILAERSLSFLKSIKPLSHLTTLQLQDAGHGREALSMEPNALFRLERWIRNALQIN
jgi:tetratricopeptide (TPR) repeat protein